MRIAVLRETREGETRVAVVPEQVPRLLALGAEVVVEAGAGERAHHDDEAYVEAGAMIEDVAGGADVVLSVQPARPDVLDALEPGAATISFLGADPDVVRRSRDGGLTTFALELVPRTGRAQAMDAVTSQAVVAGYRGAIVAAGLLRDLLPAMTTAAGALPPARVVVLGAGVAGLQAIATLARLGADVGGFDVRPDSAAEIASVGGRPLDLGLAPLTGEAARTRFAGEEHAARLRARLAPYVVAADAVVTAAAVPGEPAPMWVARATVEAMRPGAAVVDLAAEAGGNVEGVVAGSVVRLGAAQVWGGRDVAAQLPSPASRLLSGNVTSLVELLTAPAAEGREAMLAPDFTDDIAAACCVTYGGEVTHEPSRLLLEQP